MVRKATLQTNTSSIDDFIKSKTSQMNSPKRRPAKKKTRGSQGTSSNLDIMAKELNPEGSPLKRKNPHRIARHAAVKDTAMEPPVLPRKENLAESEKPPELTDAEKRVLRLMEKKEEQRKRDERKARKELRRLEKEEKKKRDELAALEEAAEEARMAEEEADEKAREQVKIDEKSAKEARRIERARRKAAKEEAEKEAERERARQEAAMNDSSDSDHDSDSDDSSSNDDDADEDSNDTEDEADLNGDKDDESDNDEEGKDQSYSGAAGGNDDDTASMHNIRWKAQRVRITIKIDVPKDKESRLINLQEKANKIITLGRRTEPNLYLRKFEETGIPHDEDKRSWIHKFSSTDLSANHFCDHLAHGLSNWLPLDRQNFYFRATLIVPSTCNFSKVLEEISHFIPDSCKITNLLSQLIFDPVKLGHLLRSNEKMTSTDGFLNELNRRAKQLNPDVVFGMSFSEMRRPNGERAKDWKKATRAVQLETNVGCMREATDIALRLFPGKRMKGHKPVWGMNLVFVYDIGHEDVNQLDTAQNNIDTLVSRQKMHMKYENRCSTNKILPGVLKDKVYSEDPDTFREVLMSIESKTTEGCEGGKIFSSIMFSDYKNKKEYWFCYHRKVKKEAEAIVRALPVMLRVEYGLIVENLFYETAIDPSDQWDPVTRSLRNAITRATDNMLDGTDDLIGEDASEEDIEIIEESESISLNTAESRERQRMMGENEEETVVNQKRKKKNKATATRRAHQRIEVAEIEQNDDENSVSTLGDGTADFSSASKKHRFARQLQCGVMLETSELVKESAKKADRRTAEMQQALDSKKKRNDTLESQLALMQQALAAAGLMAKPASQDSSTTSKKSGSAQSNGQASGQEENTPNGVYQTPLRANTQNRSKALEDDESDDKERKAAGDHEENTEDGYSYSIEYEKNPDGTVTARRITTHPDGHQTSRIITPDDLSASQEDELDEYNDDEVQDERDDGFDDQDQADEGNASQQWNADSMTASVQSASSLIKKGVRSMVEKATGGNPGQGD